MRHQSTYIACLLTVLLFSACFVGGGRSVRGGGEPKITVSIEPLRYLTSAIAGDKFRVVSLVPSGVSPETYDPTPSQLVTLSESRACFLVGGLGFERTYRSRLTDSAPHLLFFNTSRGINPIMEAHSHHHHDSEQEAAEEMRPGMEPHVWTSPANVSIMARNIAEALITIDHDNEAYYVKRYEELCQAVAQTDSTLRRLLSSPEVGRTFLIYHPALTYFARDYGLRQIAIEAEGKEPSPSRLVELTEEARREGVRVVFVQAEFDTRNAKLIAEQIGAEVVTVNPLSYNWAEELVHIAECLSPGDK